MGTERMLYVVYDKPSDYPADYVVRRHLVKLGRLLAEPDPYLVCKDLELIRKHLASLSLYRLNRFADDDPVILETWL